MELDNCLAFGFSGNLGLLGQPWNVLEGGYLPRINYSDSNW